MESWAGSRRRQHHPKPGPRVDPTRLDQELLYAMCTWLPKIGSRGRLARWFALLRRGRLLSLLTVDVRRPHVAEIRFRQGAKDCRRSTGAATEPLIANVLASLGNIRTTSYAVLGPRDRWRTRHARPDSCVCAEYTCLRAAGGL